jgi:hypothetical protein
VGYQLAYPVMNSGRAVITTTNSVPDLLASNPYSFAFWSYYAVLQKRVTQAASLINTAGRYASRAVLSFPLLLLLPLNGH